MIDSLKDWETVNTYTWAQLLVFEDLGSINISENGEVFYSNDGSGNGSIVWDGTNAYARRNE